VAALVLDASVVLAVALQEANRRLAAPMLARAAENGAIVPNLWHIEIGNALLIAQRRGTITVEERAEVMRELTRLHVTIDPETASQAWRESFVLAQMHRLTLYDATYLELSLRQRLPLATFDAALQRAATAAHVPLP
jgi:predicted nucleic acid-binding protein